MTSERLCRHGDSAGVCFITDASGVGKAGGNRYQSIQPFTTPRQGAALRYPHRMSSMETSFIGHDISSLRVKQA